MSEKRQFPRLDIEADVTVNHQEKTQAIIKAAGKNISAEGLSFVSTQEFKKDDMLELTLKTEKTKVPIEVKGTVAWVEPFSINANTPETHYIVGVKIADESLHIMKELIHQYINELLSDMGNQLNIK